MEADLSEDDGEQQPPAPTPTEPVPEILPANANMHMGTQDLVNQPSAKYSVHVPNRRLRQQTRGTRLQAVSNRSITSCSRRMTPRAMASTTHNAPPSPTAPRARKVAKSTNYAISSIVSNASRRAARSTWARSERAAQSAQLRA